MNDLSNSNFAEQLQARERMPAALQYETAMDLAGEVFKFVETHKTPPVPIAYEVWYSYASHSDISVRQRIDLVVDNGGILSSYDIEQIHQEFLAPTKGADEASLGIDSEMEAVLKMVESYLDSSKSYSGSLNSSLKDLSDTAKPEQLRRTVELLISENKKMSTEANKLSDNLEQSKVQIEEMRACLAEAREDGLRDPLTNLANRRKFEQTLVKEMAEAKADETDMCLVMLDIDHFKAVNDTFG
ncbi:MAG: diguanylate cyclase, partial [Hyphomicrobiales bacterium]|nr:diguanylate cyclase [Hyphomicrobiales bacterium]